MWDCTLRYFLRNLGGSFSQTLSEIVRRRWPQCAQTGMCNHIFIMSQLTLGGPLSPLELKVHSMIERHHSLEVHVGSDSVNAVLLNEWPEDPRSTMLVAAHVTQHSGSKSITLHQTTVMPDVPGLTALVAVLFAPRAEYRYASRNLLNLMYDTCIS